MLFQTVKQSYGPIRIAKYIHPPRELKVRSNDETPLFVALEDELKQQLTTLAMNTSIFLYKVVFGTL